MVQITRRQWIGGAMLAGGMAALGSGLIAPMGAFAQDLPPDAMKTYPELEYVNPELRPYVIGDIKWARTAPSMAQLYKEARRNALASVPKPLPGIPLKTVKIPVGKGIADVTLYVINAAQHSAGPRPAILHTHGGGFVFGSAQWEIPAKQELARRLDCVIVTVEYALAPEATYKISMEQNYAALKWLHDHATELGVDPSRIAVMGESAGGGHAALLAITARDREEVPVAFQCLIYPMLDDRTGSVNKPAPPIGVFGWRMKDNVFGWQSFLGQPPGTASVPVAAVPSRTRDLAGLPPAFIGVGSIDLFVDEDVHYARRLVDAGVMTELHLVPGASHGFDGYGKDTSIGRQFTLAKENALRRAFGMSLT